MYTQKMISESYYEQFLLLPQESHIDANVLFINDVEIIGKSSKDRSDLDSFEFHD